MERRSLRGEIYALVSLELEGRGFLAAFTERTGGASAAPFSSLNVGRDTGDEPSTVEENCRAISSALGLAMPATARQVHGDHVVSVTEGERAPVDIAEADGLTTSERSLPLAVVVADCVPLVLASEREGRVAAIHVGWRGLAAGIIGRALSSFDRATETVAAIGPAIGPCHYVVGEEVVDAVRSGTGGLALTRPERSTLDLPGTVAALLHREGVSLVDRASECTACEPSRLFSHRRDGRTGRQAGLAVRL